MTDDDFAATPKMRIKNKDFFLPHAPWWLRRSLWVYEA